MSKQEKNTTALNEKLMEEFSTNLETTINEVCESNSNTDPRLELLVTLGLFSAQVGVDAGYDKEEFLALMEEMFDDLSSEEEQQEKKSKQIKIDISKLN